MPKQIISENEIIEILKEWAIENKRTPRNIDVEDIEGLPSGQCIAKKYGWNNILKKAGLKTWNFSPDNYDCKAIIIDYLDGLTLSEIVQRNGLKNKMQVDRILKAKGVKRNRRNETPFCKCGKRRHKKSSYCKECKAASEKKWREKYTKKLDIKKDLSNSYFSDFDYQEDMPVNYSHSKYSTYVTNTMWK